MFDKVPHEYESWDQYRCTCASNLNCVFAWLYLAPKGMFKSPFLHADRLQVINLGNKRLVLSYSGANSDFILIGRMSYIGGFVRHLKLFLPNPSVFWNRILWIWRLKWRHLCWIPFWEKHVRNATQCETFLESPFVFCCAAVLAWYREMIYYLLNPGYLLWLYECDLPSWRIENCVPLR